MRIFITGANGFVGSAGVKHLASLQHHVVAHARTAQSNRSSQSHCITPVQGEFVDIGRWMHAMQGCDAVLHTAARVHQVNDTAAQPLAAYRQVNVQHTLNLARAAADLKVARFVFVSSIKVNGEWSHPNQPFTADSATQGLDPYGISKLEAEDGLREIARQTGLEVVIVRPPLVYGPGVRANFLTMMRWLQWGVPLPLGAIRNQRSLLGLGNLVDLLEKCLVHPAATGQTFLASDGQDVSTTQLLAMLAHALDVKPRLVPVPQALLESTLRLVGRSSLAQRLCGNLAVDIDKTRSLLDWTPPYSLEQGLKVTAQHFSSQRTL